MREYRRATAIVAGAMVAGFGGAFAMLTCAIPVRADQPPSLFPTRDVTAVFEVTDRRSAQASRQVERVQIAYSAAERKLRIEPAGQPNYSVIDRGENRMMIVMPDSHFYLNVPFDERRFRIFGITQGTFERVGTDTVAGLGCTVWHVALDRPSSGRPEHGELCLTNDGVLLRARRTDPGPDAGEVEAVSVTYGALPASLFAPPQGFAPVTQTVGAALGHLGEGHIDQAPPIAR